MAESLCSFQLTALSRVPAASDLAEGLLTDTLLAVSELYLVVFQFTESFEDSAGQLCV